MVNKELIKEYRFQKENAGYAVGRRAAGALQLAKASLLLSKLEHFEVVTITWAYDKDADRGPIDWGWDQKEIDRWNQSSHEVEYCQITDKDGDVLASLSGIWDADTRYKRVVEAELANECFGELEKIAENEELS